MRNPVKSQDGELEFKGDGMTITVQRRRAHRSHPAAYMAKSRIHVWLPNSMDPRNESPEIEWAGKSDIRAREYGNVLKHFADEALRVIRMFIEPGVLFAAEEGNLRFSWTAGCSCGCSPGVIFDAAPIRLDGMNADVWVTIDEDTRS